MIAVSSNAQHHNWQLQEHHTGISAFNCSIRLVRKGFKDRSCRKNTLSELKAELEMLISAVTARPAQAERRRRHWRDPSWSTRFCCAVWGGRDQWCVFCKQYVPHVVVNRIKSGRGHSSGEMNSGVSLSRNSTEAQAFGWRQTYVVITKCCASSDGTFYNFFQLPQVSKSIELCQSYDWNASGCIFSDTVYIGLYATTLIVNFAFAGCRREVEDIGRQEQWRHPACPVTSCSVSCRPIGQYISQRWDLGCRCTLVRAWGRQWGMMAQRTVCCAGCCCCCSRRRQKTYAARRDARLSQ